MLLPERCNFLCANFSVRLSHFVTIVFVFSLNDLAEFIKVADVGLTQPVEEGDYNGLVAVMGHLMAVKDRQTVTDEMFEPLKQTIELLKTYGQEMPEEVHTQLQVKRFARAITNLFTFTY